MKKTLSIAFVLMLAISLTACGNGASKGENPAKKSSEVSNSGKISREEGLDKLMEISEKLSTGEITPEESAKLSKEIKDKMRSQEESLKRENGNISTFDGLPSWAKSLNMSEPEGLTLKADESTITKESGNYSEGFTAVYTGDKERLFSEAKKLAENLGLKVDMDMAEVFMAGGEIDKYSVLITASKDKLVYTVTDLTAQKELMKKYNK